MFKYKFELRYLNIEISAEMHIIQTHSMNSVKIIKFVLLCCFVIKTIPIPRIDIIC